MKGKMKLDLQSIKSFALEHGEKLAFGVVGLVFLMLVYSALKRESLPAERQPDKLQAMVQQVQSHVSQSAFDAASAEIVLVDYIDRAKRELVNLDPYKTNALNNPVIDAKAKRDAPTLFAIEEIRADSGFGAFSLSAEGPGEKKARGEGGDVGFHPGPQAQLVGRGYTVVTGLVPFRKQVQEYSRLFDQAQASSPERNRPRYVRLAVQRADVDPAQPDKTEWKDLPPSDFAARFEAYMPPNVPDNFRQDELCAPLGPLVGHAWGASVSHPRIASAVAAASESSDAAPERKGANQADAKPVSQPTSSEKSTVEYKLCRVFDYSVEPMKKYRYRVKAVLQNPNYQVAPQYLVKPETGTVEFVETEWSAPTGTVAVPDRFGVLAVSVGEDSKRDAPAVKMLATAIDPNEGIEAGTEVQAYRSSVINLKAPRVEATDPRSGEVRELTDVDFRTGIVVVDIHGGQQLSRRFGSSVTGPVEILVMDPQGNLRVHSELQDRASVDALAPKKEVIPEKEKKEEHAIPEGPNKPRRNS